jgi:hypothetical protein
MQASQTPTLVPLAFAANGTKNAIPEASQIGISPGAASLNDGFPPLTFTPIAAGGVPPAGADFNGIFNLLSQTIRWVNAGGHFKYNSTFANDPNVGGYPAGAILLNAAGTGIWQNTVDGNTTNPDTGGAGWVAGFSSPLAVGPATAANHAMQLGQLAPVNNTGASSDLSLSIGQSAYIDFSAVASVPLHIACGDNQSYEMEVRCIGNTGSTSGTTLNPNNATHTNFFVWGQVFNLSTSPSANGGFLSGFIIAGSDIRYRKLFISTTTISKTVISTGYSYLSSSQGLSVDSMGSSWQAAANSNTVSDTTTPWTSLGTVTFPVPATGRIIVRRAS